MALLYDLIKYSGEGNEKATIEIIKKFSPLLNKYRKKLNYEYADTDLIIALIEIIGILSKRDKFFINKEGSLVNYISKSIKHKYIQLSKTHENNFKHGLLLYKMEFYTIIAHW